MEPVLKLLLFGFCLFCMAFLGYRTYRFLNQKITGSRTGWELLVYSFSLIVVNVLIFFGGLLVLFSIYNWLKD